MIYKFNDFELDTKLFELRKEAQARHVEPQVLNVLNYLITHRDRIISKQELFEQLWPGKIISESTLNTRIKEARQAVDDNGSEQAVIATYNRRGYRFIANVIEQAGALQDNTTADDNLRHHDTAANSGALASCLDNWDSRPSIAVVPFAHSAHTNETDWLAEMLTEDITIRLARIPGFLVVSRNTTSSLVDKEISIQQMGKELGTRYIIQGSLWDADGTLRVSVQLMETESGQLLWADRKPLDMDRIKDFQDEVVREIIAQIEPELARAELTYIRSHRPVALDAWSLYRQASAILGQKGWSEDTFTESANLLREAVKRDPELAFAHAYLSLILAIGHLVGLVHEPNWKEEATRAAETAIELDSQDSDVLGYSGCAFADMGDHSRGMRLMERAIELNPSNAQAWAALGAAKLQLADEEGIQYMRHGMRISPKDNRLAVWGALLSRGLLSFGRIDEALEVATDACRHDDKIFLPRIVLAIAQCLKGNLKLAAAAWHDARRIRPGLSLDEIQWIASDEEIKTLTQANL